MAGLNFTTSKANILEISPLIRESAQRTPSQAEPRQNNLDRSLNMQHEILAFDKKTEGVAFSIEIPADQYDKLSDLMSWSEPEDAIYEYDLSPEQVGLLERMTGKTFNSPDYIFQLSCSE